MKQLKSILSLIIIVSFLFGMINVYAVDSTDYINELPITENGTVAGTSGYRGVITVYSDSEAADAGVPAGYFGHVVKVESSPDALSNTKLYPTCDFDFSAQNIPIASIESITFRVYMYSGDRAIRLKTPYTSASWVMNVTPSAFGEWTEITLDSSGTNFINGCSLSSLANSDGNLGQLALIGRIHESGENHFFIDSITVKYKAGVSDDKTPPVITYNGPTEFTAKEGEKFTLDGISAYDEYDDTTVAISYDWSVGAVNGAGELQAGTHVCTVKATDRSGNTSSVKITVTVAGNPFVIKLDSVPYTDYISGVSIYDGAVRNLTSDEAAAAGVPSGYSGNVLEVKGSTYRFGMTFDPRSIGVQTCLIDRITFRFYFRESTNAIRMSEHGEGEWTVLADAGAGRWMEYTLYADGTGFSNQNDFASLADSDGKLGVFGIATKYSSGANYTFYIDSVVINIKDDGSKPPVMTYDGKTDIVTSSGKPFKPAITAFDELENRKVELEYDWSEGAIDKYGNMLEGEHTCRVSATDYQGNTSYIDFNLTVGPKDVTAPTIQFTAKEIHVAVGTFDRMVIKCADDYDDVDVEVKWSAGAVDFGGRLNKGTHTLTLTATDLTGNKTVMVVKVYVTESDDVVGKLIECGK